jgi:hypothetical protein
VNHVAGPTTASILGALMQPMCVQQQRGVPHTRACAASMLPADMHARNTGPQGSPRKCSCAPTLLPLPTSLPCLCSQGCCTCRAQQRSTTPFLWPAAAGLLPVMLLSLSSCPAGLGTLSEAALVLSEVHNQQLPAGRRCCLQPTTAAPRTTAKPRCP